MHTKALNLSRSAVLKEVAKTGAFILGLALAARIKVYLPFSPVPMTLQTLVVFLSAVSLGRRTFVMLGAYLALGVLGAPVFSGGLGLAYLAGPTGGYIAGFFLASALLVKVLPLQKNLAWYILSFLAADLIILALGSLWLTLTLRMSLVHALAVGALPFIYGDSLKIALAALITNFVKIRNPNTCLPAGRSKFETNPNDQKSNSKIIV
ncbi:biotin transporter BioY [Candidatus Omnitrophota bacterium]